MKVSVSKIFVQFEEKCKECDTVQDGATDVTIEDLVLSTGNLICMECGSELELKNNVMVIK